MSSQSKLAAAVAVTLASTALPALAVITGFGGFAAPNNVMQGANDANGVPTIVPSTDTSIGYSADGSTFHVTSNQNSERVSGYNPNAQDITSFTTSFDYQSIPGYSDANGTVAADGIGFNLINPSYGTTALANPGTANALGVLDWTHTVNGASVTTPGLTNSASLLFNNFGGFYNFPGAVSLQTKGNPSTVHYQNLPGPGVAADVVHVDANYSNGILRYTITDKSNGKTFKAATNVDLAGAVGGSTALVGFSGATGGFNANQNVSNFSFTGGTGTAFVNRNSILSTGAFKPVALSGGFNQAVVVPAQASVANGDPFFYITATLDNGTYLTAAGTGATFYETGLAGATAGTGLPTSGSTFTSQADPRHTFKMPTYNTNGTGSGQTPDSLTLFAANKDIAGTGQTTGSLTFATPIAASALSVLTAAGNGPAPVGVVVHYTDGTTADLGDLSSPDWYGAPAWNAGSRIDPGALQFQDGPFGLGQYDLALPLVPKLINSVTFTLDGASDTGSVASIFGVSATTGGVYKLAGAGDFASAGSWVGTQPNAVDAVAIFGSSITANTTVSLNSAATVGGIDFENAKSYTLGGTGPLTLDVSTGSAYVNVISGAQAINVPLTIADPAVVNVNNGASLSIGGPVALTTGNSLTTNGPVTFAGTITGAAGSNVLVGSGTTTFAATQHLDTLTTSANTVAKLSDTAGHNVLRAKGLALNASSQLDLTDNALVIDYTDAASSPFATIQTLTKIGYNAAGTHWGGYGIISSNAAANGNYGIGVVEAGSINATSFLGESVDSTTVLARYTLLGDSNIDGSVNFSDLLALARSYGVAGNWVNGDSNYDGTVNFNDLLALARNYGQTLTADQAAELGSSFTSDFALAQALAPEPTSALALVAAAGLLTNGRRRRASSR